MKLETLEKRSGKLSVRVNGETHSFLNLLRENAWKRGCDQASYIIENPYMSEPKIIVRGKDPKDILDRSAKLVVKQAKDFRKEFRRVCK